MQYILSCRLRPWLKLFFVCFAVVIVACSAIKNHPKINYSQFKDLLSQNQVVRLEIKAGEATVQLREGAEVTLLGQGPEQIRTDLTRVSMRMPKTRDKDLLQQLQAKRVQFVEQQSPELLKSMLPLWMTVVFIGFLIFATFSVVLGRLKWSKPLGTRAKEQSTLRQ